MVNKKGQFFLMITVIVISLFVLSISFFSNYAHRRAVQERVESMSNFVSSTESDLQRQIFISGYRAVFFMEKQIVDSGTYLTESVNSSLQKAFFNGTIASQDQPLLYTFTEIEQDVGRTAQSINAQVNFTNPRISIGQEDPWNVIVTFASDFYLVDEGNLVSWNKTLVVRVPIALSNFTDPVYLVGSHGEVAPVILRSPYVSFDSSSLAAHISGGYYLNNTQAPDFIGRLEHNFSSSIYGIESLVNVVDIPADYQTGNSIVDYKYFEGSENGCHIAGMDNWVRLDNGHLAVYNAICG